MALIMILRKKTISLWSFELRMLWAQVQLGGDKPLNMFSLHIKRYPFFCGKEETVEPSVYVGIEKCSFCCFEYLQH